MLTILKTIGFKNIAIGILITFIGAWISYKVTNYKKTIAELNETKKELVAKDIQLKDEKEKFELTVEAYEKTLAIEREISSQKAITQEQKEVVVTKYKTLVKEVEKRGEIKQDEKSSFTIVTF